MENNELRKPGINSNKETQQKERGEKTMKKIERMFAQYSKLLIIQCSNVQSYQLQKIRKLLRGQAEILRGKTFYIRTAIRNHIRTHPEMEPLLQHIKGEVGLVFTNGDIFDIKNKLVSEIVHGEAKLNKRATADVILKGNTCLEPHQTSFMGALGIATKVMKGKMYIINDFKLIAQGDRVGKSELTLLNYLNLKPFIHAVKVTHAYQDGHILDEYALNLDHEAQIWRGFNKGLQQVAAVSIAIGLPNTASLMHIIRSGIINVNAVTAATNKMNK